MKTLARVMLVWMIVAATGASAWAADPGQGEAAPAQAEAAKPALSTAHAVAIVGSCLGAALCAIGGGLAIAHIGAKCIEAIARQPEAAGTMFAPMIVSAAMVEGGMLFAIVVCLLGVLGL